MSNLQHKSKSELQVIDEIVGVLFRKYDFIVKIGDIFWETYNGFCTLIDITLKNPDLEDKYNSDNIILHLYNPDYNKDPKYQVETKFLSEHLRSSYVFNIETDDIESFKADVESLANGTVSMQDLVKSKYDVTEESQSTGLISMNKDVLIEKKTELIKQQNFAASRTAYVKGILERRMQQMRQVAAEVQKFVQKLNRLIYSIELYLGVKEELHQFQFGASAPIDEPICLRQRRLYMDIEMGDPTDDLKGIDFKNIEDFDNWLIKENPYWKQKNYERLIPESKCVAIFKVREHDKNYHPTNPYLNFAMNEGNRLTYILIRNGENIYRIYADIIIDEKLFPDQFELENLVGIMAGEKDKIEDRYSRVDAEKADKILERYKLNMILLQGIIERTPCFPDNQYTTSIFNPETYEGKIKFIYDATKGNLLPSNVPVFSEWHKQLNQTIEEGSRVFLISRLFKNNYDDTQGRLAFKRYYSNEYNVPRHPNDGIYQVYQSKEDYKGYYQNTMRKPLFIKYNPGGDRTWSWTDSYDTDITRKNNLSFEIFKADTFLINYDAIDRKSLETLEFYLYTRIGREDYLSYIPILDGLFKAKQVEIKAEDDFIKLALSMAGMNPDDNFQDGIDAMEWWKLKNKWKRSLNVDDTKALRMIIKYLNK